MSDVGHYELLSKNHGYELEHNFGHDETLLAMTLAGFD
jgi:hypothetical protein